MSLPYTLQGDDVLLAVRLTPRGGRDAVIGVVDAGDGRSALAVRVSAPPVEGAANKALLALLAKALGLPKSRLSIASGETARLKIVRLAGASPAQLETLL